ncbi:HD domain-containing protein [Pseudodonghicola flavimaris]|uniref:HD domain-containing protein n=1 Tax=Pseudodonghicola flavimaris TaxID=3050036 RepID=A0ABT7EX31_9RHOB|nr:HD domain-containing protein [Pseudodonghicola flavimaris]MDK3016902.1 HD domain-containing protein [Pseudodonghicola flavimaris]
MADLDGLRARLRQIAAHRMAQDSAHDLAHLDRVWANARTIADADADRQVLLAASYLHDLVNLPKDSPDRARASTLAARAAAPILHDLGFAPDRIAATRHAIAAHSFSAGLPPETPEARILRDADRLDALGAIGIARCFAVSGALGRPLYDPADPFATARNLDDRHQTLDHFRVKLLRLPADMLTRGGRALAQRRAARMIRFLEDLAEEIGTDLPPDWKTP